MSRNDYIFEEVIKKVPCPSKMLIVPAFITGFCFFLMCLVGDAASGVFINLFSVLFLFLTMSVVKWARTSFIITDERLHLIHPFDAYALRLENISEEYHVKSGFALYGGSRIEVKDKWGNIYIIDPIDSPEEFMKTLFEARKKRIAAISEKQAGDKNQ